MVGDGGVEGRGNPSDHRRAHTNHHATTQPHKQPHQSDVLSFVKRRHQGSCECCAPIEELEGPAHILRADVWMFAPWHPHCTKFGLALLGQQICSRPDILICCSLVIGREHRYFPHTGLARVKSSVYSCSCDLRLFVCLSVGCWFIHFQQQ